MGINKERRKVLRFLAGLGSIVLSLFLFPVKVFGGGERPFRTKNSFGKNSKPLRNKSSRVVIARSNRIETEEGSVNGNVIQKMVDEGVTRLTGKDKLRLIICDGIRGVYNGGPGYKAPNPGLKDYRFLSL